MDYYKPSTIFRQNAMKRCVSNPELSPTKRKFSNESWLFDTSIEDNVILNKSCSTTKPKILSNYWKIPDEQLYLTSISINPENPEQIAISSGNNESNLFIYDLKIDDMLLTHQQTITLPNIESLQWLNYDEEESTILTGHKNGTVHLVSIPKADGNESARIIKRFNHKKHFQTSRYKNLSIKQLMKSNWYNNNQNSMLSLCNENVFLWDLEHRSDLPIIKNQILGLQKFDSSPHKNGIIALAGDFGIAINDLRAPINTPSIFTPKLQANDSFNSNGANIIKWAPYDSNILAASHYDGCVRLWDIRAQGSFGKLTGHNDLVSSLEWSEQSSSDLYTGGRDGNIIHWDLDFNEDLSDCCLNGGLESIKLHKEKFLIDESDIYEFVNKRQCGNIIPAAKNPIVQMVGFDDKILSIDGSSYLGVHNKSGVDSFKVPEGVSDQIMDELMEEVTEQKIEDTRYDDYDEHSSRSTLIGSPCSHKHQQSITNLQNNSDHSLNTLISESDQYQPSKFQLNVIKRKDSDATMNENEQEQESLLRVKAGFTYEKIMPLFDTIGHSNYDESRLVV